MSMSNNECFVIAEAGSNWKCGSYDDDLKQAEKLIKTAANSGANAVKFQTYKSQTIYVEDAGVSKYLADTGTTEKINELFDYLSMPYEMIPELKKICDKENILFMSTPFSIDDATALDPYVSIHKIASFEINHVRLLEFVAQTKKPVLVSTGASDKNDIRFAIDYLQKHGASDITLLQCTSKYPCPVESLNLKSILTMKTDYNLHVGFSDHSLDPILAPITALSLGATVIEKHFTLDKNLSGPDHKFALEPHELKNMIDSIRTVEKTMGDGNKIILDDEMELRQFATRSLQAIKDIKKDEKLIEGKNFEVLRPGNHKRGLPGRYLLDVNNKFATNDIKKGDGITSYR